MKKSYLLLLLLVFSCCTNNNSKYIEAYNSTYKDIIGKHIDWKAANLLPANKHFNYSKSYPIKILLIVGTDCSECIEKFKQWNAFLAKGNFNNVDIIFVALGGDNEYFNYHVNKVNSFNFKIYFDPSDTFVEKNNLSLHFKDAFLLDKNNNIQLIGNPTENRIIKEYFDEKISEISE